MIRTVTPVDTPDIYVVTFSFINNDSSRYTSFPTLVSKFATSVGTNVKIPCSGIIRAWNMTSNGGGATGLATFVYASSSSTLVIESHLYVGTTSGANTILSDSYFGANLSSFKGTITDNVQQLL